MQKSGKISQLLITIYICTICLLLLQEKTLFSNTSISNTCIAIFCFSISFIIILLPAFYLFKYSKKDDLYSFNPKLFACIIIFFMMWGTVRTLMNYCNMFTTCVNPNASHFVVALIVILSAVYSAYKGIASITRCGLIIFCVFVISLVVILFSNFANIDLDNIKIESMSYSDVTSIFLSLFPICFPIILFILNTEYSKGKLKKSILTYIFFVIVTVVSLIFINILTVGSFGNERKYSFFTLSKIVKIESFEGLDSLFLIAITVSMFLFVSMILGTINKLSSKNCSLCNSILYAVIIFVFYICADNLKSISNILQNNEIFAIMCVVCIFVIPIFYLIKIYFVNIFRKKQIIEKTQIESVKEN